jgi:uncharacterized protein (DUF1800 family)
MLIWLDAASDKKENPNENFARELLERFTMGIGTYSELDVRAAAFCFTGWRFDRATGSFVVDQHQHSTTPQTFLGIPGITTGQQVIDIASHSSASARYVPAAFWSHLAYPVTTSDPVVAELSIAYAGDHNVAKLLAAIFTHPKFTSAQAATGLVKQPVEYLVGALRALQVPPSAVMSSQLPVYDVLADLGQIPFDPPSVGGWSQNEYWLSTAAALARWRFASRLARVADISPVSDVPPSSRLDAAAALLGITGWTAPSAATLREARANPEELMTLAMVSPEYVTN